MNNIPKGEDFATRLGQLEHSPAVSRIWEHRATRVLLALVGLAVLFIAITAPLELRGQLLFAVCAAIAALLLRRIPGRLVTIAMVLLSIVVSSRYMYWRLTSTLGFSQWIDMAFGYGLLLAEIYALAVLLLGYVQTIWPLQRTPVALPADASTWPTVDILIPTYNEPLDVVKQSILTSVSIDWPHDKVKIYVLDDGRRQEFRDFCALVGVHYITREGNEKAKAGNLNHALTLTDGEYVAMFDCDHIPTRSFLQICMGWFLKDPKLAMLQTPHHFFSPDPFEKNLNTFRTVPNEGELFYGLVQDGNDLWNAAFFCGSCAIMRRSQLMEIGGIADETVTEDAHTALKLNRAGYNTAYLPVPQAAGLATENLSRHVGQRIRWARGMAQIFRVDNPLLGHGLSAGQRMCYLNAMLHFFYGLPRLVFLTAPLAFLFFGSHVFQASAVMITVYAFPHILHSNITASRMQGRFRHSFWNEVYESVLAWYIMRPTLLALVNPKMGGFNVTAKGSTANHAYFDWDLAKPYLILLALNVTGMLVGLGQLLFGHLDSAAAFTFAINLAWTLYNIVITSASVAVAREERQFRAQPRVAVALPAMIRLANGKTLACSTTDYSASGLGVKLPDGASLPTGEQLHVSLYRGNQERMFPAEVVFGAASHVGLRFGELDIRQQIELAEMTFARADTWANTWGHGTPDTPFQAFKEVTRTGLSGITQVARFAWAEARNSMRDRLPAKPLKTTTRD
jgi:cellulose synthase (UDP-forming)